MGPAIEGTTWKTLFQGMQRVCRHGGSIDQMAQALGAIELPQPEGRAIELRQLRTPDALRWSASCLSKLDPIALDPVIAGRWLEGVNGPVSRAKTISYTAAFPPRSLASSIALPTPNAISRANPKC